MPELAIDGLFTASLRELRAVWSSVLPRRFER